MSILSQQEIAAPINEVQPQKETKPTLDKTNETYKVKYFTTKRIVYIATLAAIAIMFKLLSNFIAFSDNMRISLIYFAWMLSAIILGPFGGAVVGFTSDVVGMLILPTGGGINPLMIIGNTLFPTIVGLFYLLPLKNKNVCILLGVLAAVIICTLGINSYAIYTMYGYNKSMSFFAYLLSFRVMQPFFVAANLIVLLTVLPVIKRLKMFDNLK